MEGEVDTIVDILSRQIIRQGVSEAVVAISPPRPPALPIFGDIFPATPKLDEIPLPILLPGVGGNQASVGLLSLKDFSDVVAPKLDQDEEIYALGLSDAAEEFFGDNVSKFLRGESVLSLKSVKLLLDGVQSGILGNDNLLNGDAAKNVIEALASVVNNLGASQTGEPNNIQDTLKEAINQLDESERKRLDAITEEIVNRSISRSTERLAGVARVF
jgi:hypothetical protein